MNRSDDFADILNQISVWILSSGRSAAPDKQVVGFNWMSLKVVRNLIPCYDFPEWCLLSLRSLASKLNRLLNRSHYIKINLDSVCARALRGLVFWRAAGSEAAQKALCAEGWHHTLGALCQLAHNPQDTAKSQMMSEQINRQHDSLGEPDSRLCMTKMGEMNGRDQEEEKKYIPAICSQWKKGTDGQSGVFFFWINGRS